MAKDALYFSHDSNASNDPKMIAMRSVYGTEGYGRYWLIIEMLREADGYKLEMRSKYAFNAYAEHLKCDCNAFASFMHDCIEEFNLFASDGQCFWSDSLLRRMQLKEEKSEKARLSAEVRWGKKQKNANASKNDALKESKEKESKVNEIKESKGEEKEIEEAPSPSDILNSPEEAQVTKWLKEHSIIMDNPLKTRDFFSYIGAVDIEVIEAAIIKSKGKKIAYCFGTLEGFIADGVTKESLKVIPIKSGGFQRTSGYSGKQRIPIIKDQPKQSPLTPEEVDEMRKLAKKLDGPKTGAG